MHEYTWRLSQLRGAVLQILNDGYVMERIVQDSTYEEMSEEEKRVAWHIGVQRLKKPFGRLCDELKCLMRDVGYAEEEVEKIACP